MIILLFKKKSISNEEENAKEKLKKLKNQTMISAFDMMRAETVTSRDQLFELCDTIVSGHALLANFEKMEVEDANYMLTFLSGVVYALKGEIHKTGPKTFLFAREEEYVDGTLHQYIEDIR